MVGKIMAKKTTKKKVVPKIKQPKTPKVKPGECPPIPDFLIR
jgi:hypothetical protein